MTENETIKDRLVSFIRYLSVSQRKFELRCGLSNGYVNNIRCSITPDKLQQIVQQYPELNAGWLMTGEGSMLKSGNISQTVTGDGNFSVAGNGNSVANPDSAELLRLRKEVETLREQNNELVKQVILLTNRLIESR